MMRVNGSSLYHLGEDLQPLYTLQPGPLVDSLVRLKTARARLDQFLHFSVFKPRTALAKGEELLEHIDTMVAEGEKEQKGGPISDISDADIAHLHDILRAFGSVLTAELNVSNLYLVFPKRGYNITELINDATVLFPPDLIQKVPEAVFDIKQAGRCLAFELSTAAGFHLHRANEAVLHRYYDTVTGGAERPKGRSMGNYLQKLTSMGCGDAKVIAGLDALRDLYRNPLIHPEQSLESIDEAIALVNAVHTVVVRMLREIP